MPTATNEADAPPIAILYRNHRGEAAVRRIIPRAWRFGESEWHPGPQWLIEAWDVDKGAERTFALAGVLELFREPDMTPKGPARNLDGTLRDGGQNRCDA